MSQLTPELALVTAEDPDDTADYLTGTSGLQGSLNIIDGLFNATTGHNHNGAHQGGVLIFSTLQTTSIQFANGATLGPTGTGNVLRFQSTQVEFSGNAKVEGTLDVTGTSTLRGATSIPNTLNVTGATTLAGVTTGAITASGLITANGGISASTVSTSGAITTPGLTVNGNAQINGNLTSTGSLTGGSITSNGTLYSAGRITGNTDLVLNPATAVLYFGSDGAVNIQRSGAIGAASHPLIVTNPGASNGLWLRDQGLTWYTPTDPQPNGNQQLRTLGPSTRDANVYGGGELSLGIRLGVSGDIYSGTYMHAISFLTTSDRSLKSNEVVVTDASCMTRVRNPALPVYSYTSNPPITDGPIAPTPTDIGFMADDAYAVVPEFVALDANSTPVSVVYGQMVAMLWGAVRDLDARCTAYGVPS